MSKSMIYTVQDNVQEVADGDIIPIGTAIHRFGNSIRQDGNAITIKNCERGCTSSYFAVFVKAEIEPAAAGPISAVLEKDGTPLIGGETTITLPASSVAPFPISLPVKVDRDANLSVRVSGADCKVTNMTIMIVRI